MKNELVSLNIDNLTSLWRSVGQKEQAHQRRQDVEIVDVNQSEWPNRIWFVQGAEVEDLPLVEQIMSEASNTLTLSYMDVLNDGLDVQSVGLEQTSELIGMGMALSNDYPVDSELELEAVKNLDQASDWVSYFEQAFGYRINSSQLVHPYPSTVFYIIKYQGQPAGTALVHHTDRVVGIHSMGVIPSMRRKGLARLVMHNILSNALEQGYEYATLQASAMGKGLYEQLGFEEHFLMKNYRLPKK
ncbi:GNAT family N-acetyltransferase [Reichenbachiella sp.]|uniref:GNAT family N-acetyltransferase n=1 Tax=Reichenbachiella sp. TaxID=2184521 RepID=UPI003BB0F710